MPNPLFLAVSKITLSQYLGYSPAKKARFQKEATRKLIALHESDIDAYNELTATAHKSALNDAEQAELDAQEDEENS